MMKSTKPRHRVIDESGRELDDTVRFPRLHHLGEVMHRHPQPAEPVSHLLHDGRNAATLTLPVIGDRRVVLRGPVRPEQPRKWHFPRSFFEIKGFQVLARRAGETDDRFHAAVAAGDARWDQIMRRLDALATRVHATSAAADARQISEQYDAAGSTAEMSGLVAEVAREIVARSLAGSAAQR